MMVHLFQNIAIFEANSINSTPKNYQLNPYECLILRLIAISDVELHRYCFKFLKSTVDILKFNKILKKKIEFFHSFHSARSTISDEFITINNQLQVL